MPIGPCDFRTPGQLVEALLQERGWTKRVLSIVLDLDETGITRLVSDKRPVDAAMAITLEELFGVPAERFLELQKSYDLAKARIAARPDLERSTRANLFGGLPIADMIRRGWIKAKDIRDVANVKNELIRFFGVNRIEDIEILPHAAKKTNFNTEVTSTQLAWLYRVKQIAKEMLVCRYSHQSVVASVQKLKALLQDPEDARKVPRILAECGIRFIVAESLPSAKIDGVCFWLNDFSPAIALSMRFDRIDNFWFVLRHELEHVIQLHGRAEIMLDTELEGAKCGTGVGIANEEKQANEAAANFCVPQKMMNAFITRKSPVFREADILALANMARVHPGLIAGQLRHYTGHYDMFGNHIVKIRSIVTPNSITDGWGDVAPLGF